MKTTVSILLLAAAIAGCAGAPVTQATVTGCAALPLGRALVDSAIARGERKMTKQDKADMAAIRAVEDARCAEAAASAPR